MGWKEKAPYICLRASPMELIIRKVQSGKELEEIFRIRETVFVQEQCVDPDLEYDDFEDTSEHFIAIVNGQAAGTARWRRTPNGIKLERFAVLAEYRGKGVGAALVEAVLADLPSRTKVYLHSQLRATSLYSRFGFEAEGDIFEEAGIDHYKMVLRAD